MEYIYSALLLHKTGQQINETNVKKVLETAGAKVDETKVKALVTSLENVDIEEVIKVTESAKLSKKVAKLNPLAVIIG